MPWNVIPSSGSGGSSSGVPTEYIFRPNEPLPSGNVFASWAALVAAIQNKPGLSVVFFDDSLAPCVIPVGAWQMGVDTVFIGNSGFGGAATPLTIDDGASVIGVFGFVDLAITCNTTNVFIDAPARDTCYRFAGFTTVVQVVSAGGAFIRSNNANIFCRIYVYDDAVLVSGPIVRFTVAAAIGDARTFSAGFIAANTFVGVAGVLVTAIVVDDSSAVNPTQVNLPGASFNTITLGSQASQESYTPAVIADWSGVAPTSVANALDRIAAKITPIP